MASQCMKDTDSCMDASPGLSLSIHRAVRLQGSASSTPYFCNSVSTWVRMGGLQIRQWPTSFTLHEEMTRDHSIVILKIEANCIRSMRGLGPEIKVTFLTGPASKQTCQSGCAAAVHQWADARARPSSDFFLSTLFQKLSFVP